VSASNILGCVCEESGKRSFPNQFGDLFHDPLLLCRHDQHNKMQEFLCCCQDTAKWSVEVNVVAIIFAVRFSRNHAVTHGNWERVLLVALLLAQKMVDDRPLCNQDFPEAYHIWDAFDRNGGEAWQVRSPLELRKINQLELAFLQIVSCSSDVVLRDTESGLRVGARALWPNCPAPPTHPHTHARARAHPQPPPPPPPRARASTDERHALVCVLCADRAQPVRRLLARRIPYAGAVQDRVPPAQVAGTCLSERLSEQLTFDGVFQITVDGCGGQR
jgi:hypothetical protein